MNKEYDDIIDMNNDFCQQLMCIDIDEKISVRLHAGGKIYKKIKLRRIE